MNKNNIWKEGWKKRKIKYPKRKHLKIDDLDKIPYVDENDNRINNKSLEREEQYITNDYITPDMTVLELGGRYGTVSCVINNKLENPRNHVVLEPDKTVINALIKNRKTHKSKFVIINGIISSKPMKISKNGYASTVLNANVGDTDLVYTISLKDIMKKFNLNFNCLVADCEGCLCDFLTENGEYIKNYKMIIFEADQPKICNYDEVIQKLKLWGFKNVVNAFISVWKK